MFRLESPIEEGGPIPEPTIPIAEPTTIHAQLIDGPDAADAQLPTTVSLMTVDLTAPLATRFG